MKLIDKINKEISEDSVYYSFEYFPPKTKQGLQNLYFKLENMGRFEPIFIDITWGAGGSTSTLTADICKNTQNVLCLETQMHLTCTNMDECKIRQALDFAKKNNIRNIMALRGDPPKPLNNKKTSENEKTVNNEKSSNDTLKFSYAIDLVKFIRYEYGDYFHISVAGYPEGHPDGEYNQDLKYLKEKVDAGADLVITQLFYDTETFVNFVKDSRKIGINCPILPGILPIINYNNFKRMTSFCKVKVPQFILDGLEPIKNDDSKVADYGVKLAIQMCSDIIKSGVGKGLHFYTLNRVDSCKEILKGLKLLRNLHKRRKLPWKPRIDAKENVRPIFWNNAKRYYLERTSDWDKFPNGRWGDKSDSQYGDISDYHLFGTSTLSDKKKLNMWEEPESIEDVRTIFVKFIKGEISHIPWCDYLADESSDISNQLINLNLNGYLTINSQPSLNGISSSDSKYGWGGDNGYIYQKAYLEFFCSKKEFSELEMSNTMSYCAINSDGTVMTNCKNKTMAVTWGIFPNKEVIQPTIVDYESFLIWKRDAFSLWIKNWRSIYQEGSKSYELIDKIHKEYYLVFIVENDYINGNIFSAFKKVFFL